MVGRLPFPGTGVAFLDWRARCIAAPATNGHLCRLRILAANFYSATSMRNLIWGVIEPSLQCASRPPGTALSTQSPYALP
jgi:hypothetical protein